MGVRVDNDVVCSPSKVRWAQLDDNMCPVLKFEEPVISELSYDVVILGEINFRRVPIHSF
jgi:hypothetical protein